MFNVVNVMFLKQHFKPITLITNYHHFHFQADGTFMTRLFANTPAILVLLEMSLNIEKVNPLK